jgi:outer membrane protein insertion porin family
VLLRRAPIRLRLSWACGIAAAAALSAGVSSAGAQGEPAPAAPVDARHVRYVLEGIELRGNTRTAGRVLLRYINFRAGDVLDVNDPEIELTRYRLLGTGFFSSVELSLRRGSRRGTAVLVVEVAERNTLVIEDLWLGIAADEDTAGNAKPISAFVGAQAAETNLAGTGITLGGGVALALDQVALRARFFDPSFAGTAWSASASLLYSNAQDFFGTRDVLFESALTTPELTDYAVVGYTRSGGSIGTGHDLTLSTHFNFEYHLEEITATVPTVASELYGNTREPIQFDILPGSSVLSSLRAGLTYDTRDAPFLTKNGTLASARLTLGLEPLGSDYGYARVELQADHWWHLPFGHVVRAGAFLGGISGSAPFFEKFYVGDFTDLLPDRVLDLAPDRRQPPNFFGTDIVEVRYGDFAGRVDCEYRIPIYTGTRSIYQIDLFGVTGLYGVATSAMFKSPPSGYTGFARVPIDLTYNLGVRVDTSAGGITFALSNLFGFIAPHNGGR